MSHPHCLRIAGRLNRLLQRELGQGLDAQRMLRDPRYARDVLLVCQALQGTDAPWLAQAFRSALAVAEDQTQAAAPAFAVSDFLHSLFDSVVGPMLSQRMALPRPRPRAAPQGPGIQALLRRSSSPPSATWSPTP
jgi:hypothetical protein